MTMRELEIQFQNAMNELQASFERQHREWQQSYDALQQQLEESKQREMVLLEEAKRREAALHAQNEQLAHKLSTATSIPQQHALVKQIKMLGAHLDALAKDAATFNHHLQNQQQAAGNFSGEQH